MLQFRDAMSIIGREDCLSIFLVLVVLVSVCQCF